jgi:ubiquinone/menaquinone biosynthesis C-methylase UbiE
LDLPAVKTRQRAAWSAGNYAIIGTTLQIVAEQLCEALDLHSGERVLDIAAGNGNLSLAAARRWCNVVGIDYVPSWLGYARRRASAEQLEIEFREGDAEALDFPDAHFDVVASTFGVMFAPDQQRAAAEALRVCRPGGRIGFANWSPDGFVGGMLTLVAKRLPPPAGLPSPTVWGTPEWIEGVFAPYSSDIRVTSRNFVFRYRSAEHWLRVFRTYFGPLVTAFTALDVSGQQALESDLMELVAHFNRAADGTMVVPGSYLEVVIVTA